MPNYIVKTVRDRNLVIEADRYQYNATEETYEFFKKDEQANTHTVATVLRYSGILAILEDDAEIGDFYHVEDSNEEDDIDEDDCDETCLDCRLEEFSKSETFFNLVISIIDFYQEETAATPAEEYPIEHWKDKDGHEWWGFHTDKGFVHFYDKVGAEAGRQSQLTGPTLGWAYRDLTSATRLED